MNLLRKIDWLMEKRGLNKRQLAIKSEIPYMTIRNWYTRGYGGMTVSTLRALCTYFGVTMDSMAYDDREIEYAADREMAYSADEASLVRRFRALDSTQQSMIRASVDTAYQDAKKEDAATSASYNENTKSA